MHKSHTKLLIWFWAIFLAAHDKRGVSAAYIARELKISYPTAWLMLHKIRKAMGERDAHYQLAGLVESLLLFCGPNLIVRKLQSNVRIRDRQRERARAQIRV
jgi:hypothetical protein